MIKVLIPLNIKNKNGRIYTKENIEPCVQDFIYRINNNGPIFGQIDHPDSFDISLSKASHIIKNIWFENNNLVGEITPLTTYYGKQLKELISSGVYFSVRPRSIGFVDINGYVQLEKIITFDIILSIHDSFYDIRKIRLDKLSKLNILSE